MLEEEWRPAVGWEGFYEVSSMGRVKACGRWRLGHKGRYYRAEHILHAKNTRGGYVRHRLGADGRSQLVLAHRLIASTFIPNPENKPEINHINGVKGDNRVENLEWCTRQENIEHSKSVLGSYKKMADKRSRPVRCIETGKVYSSARRASQETGVHLRSIWQVAHTREVGVNGAKGHRQHTAGGYHWEWAN